MSAWEDLRRDLTRLGMMSQSGVTDEMVRCMCRISAMGRLSHADLVKLREVLASRLEPGEGA